MALLIALGLFVGEDIGERNQRCLGRLKDIEADLSRNRTRGARSRRRNGPEGERTQEGASRYLNLERPDDDALVRLEPTNSLRTVRLGATRIAVLKR